MAIPNNYIDKIKDKDSGESRPICPPADHVSVDNENYEGETLDEVLDEVSQAIEEAGQGGYAPPQGGIPKTDLAQSVQDSLDKANSALQDEDVAEVAKTGSYNDLENKPTIPDTSGLATKTELQQGLGGKQDTINDLASIRTGAGKGATAVQSVSVESEQDGTVDIHVDDDTYSINLNHEHQGMAKLAKFVAGNPPASMANDTIYAQVDNLATPTEIQSLWLFGCEFAGGIPDTGLPQVYKPINGSVIDLGETDGSGVSKAVPIKARNLTSDLNVTVGTGLTVAYDGTTGSSVTIPKAQALLGAQVTISYNGSVALDDGSLVISHGGSVLSSAEVVATALIALDAIKLTGSQWLQTDYKPNANTEFEMEVKFTANSNTGTDNANIYILSTYINAGDRKKFFVYNGGGDYCNILFMMNESNLNYNGAQQKLEVGSTNIQTDHAKITYTKGQNNGVYGFHYGAQDLTVNTSLKTSVMENPMCIGYYPDQSAQYAGPYNVYDLTIYSLIITENGNTVRHYVPKSRNGIPGLYDTETGSFISSETSTDLEAIPLT